MTFGHKTINFKSFLSFFLLILIVFLTIYSYRFIFSQSYDFDYLEDFYYHSQWVVPQSPRIMRDGELYTYAAGELLQGADPFSINPETPPLGKYLFSLIILIFNNPLILSPIIYISLVTCFYYLAKYFYSDSTKINLLTIIFASSAILTTQLQETALDLPQTLFFTAHILLILNLVKSKPKTWSLLPILSGVALGMFSATKPPIITPLIIIFDLYLFWKNGLIKYILPIVTFTFLTYLLSYLQFFLLGNSPIDWIKNQIWVFNFYKNSQTTNHPLSIITYLLSGYSYQDKILTYIPEWNLSWLFGFLLIFKKNSNNSPTKDLNSIKLLLLALIVFFLFPTFAKRYVLLILPLLVLLLGQIQKKLLFYTFIFLHLIHYSIFIQSESIKPITNFALRLQEQRYQDAYQYLSHNSKENISRELFIQTLRKVDEELQVSSVEVDLINPSMFLSPKSTTSPLSISRLTPIGNYQLDRFINLKKESNQWLVDWDWQVVAPQFSPSDSLLLEIDPVIGGTLTTSDNYQLSYSGEKDYLYILGLDHQDDVLLQHISNITGVGREKLRAQAYVLSEVGAKIPVGFIGWNVNQESLDYVIDSSNVVLEKRQGRVYPPELLIEKYLKIIQTIENHHPQIFPTVGGEINLKKSDKIIPIYKSISISGQNVDLDLKTHQILDEDAVLVF